MSRTMETTTWTATTDRLPEREDDVLWQPRKVDGQPYELPVVGHIDQWGANVIGGRRAYPVDFFSHWMPLPEAP